MGGACEWGWWVLMGAAGGRAGSCGGRLQLVVLSSCSAISLQCGFFKRKQTWTPEEDGLTEAEQQENGGGEEQAEGDGEGEEQGEGDGEEQAEGDGEEQAEGDGEEQAEGDGEEQAEGKAEVAVAGAADTDNKELELV